ncbi:branched-chain amino acid transaminase [Sinorhizobium meliloti]|uniref:branched-chain amino acid transaminase n=1 Tax=Rhizobium meliloti TaxID=382 RepID=UPI000B4A0698|nr:branched-chain amino acid transaminase [Sinorhizobium meliloti]ASP94019.1 branched-chain amino acid aminotransferase [Sinorhizobium meliloti]MQX60929.1 branched-chain amino acid transaminase [Sinorhizobium meliloti]
MTLPEFAYFNGKIVPWNDAKVHIFSPVAKYGIGIFEGIRGYWNPAEEQIYLFRLRDHLERYAFSQKAMRFDAGPSDEELTQALIDLCRANQFRTTVHIRMMAFIDEMGEMGATGPVGTAVTALPRATTKQVSAGASAQISSWMRMPDNVMPARIKCNANYHNSRLAVMQAQRDGYDVALLLNSRGKLSEAPAMCVFMVRDGQLITPGATSDILESITRQTVMEIAEEYLGLKTVERDVDRTELILAEEVFYCGTGAEITPVTSVDRIAVGSGEPGAITRRLQHLYLDLVTGDSKDHPQWRTAIY